MRYRDTAIQIFDPPMSSAPDLRWARWEQRLAMLVSVLGLLALVGLVGFVVFGIVSQRL